MVDDADATGSVAPEMAGAALAAPAMVPIAAGDVFVDDPEHYEVTGEIGAGGMGTVLAARGARLGRPVALKVVTLDREELRARFEREARITARLQHPSIVPVYGSGRDREGRPFYVMKQVTGEPLDKVVAQAQTLAKRIALLPQVIAVSEAIAYAHAQRVIHRDLKPANILVGAYGETVVIDWGLAKDLADTAPEAGDVAAPGRGGATSSRSDETALGKVIGTPAYMSLEQARGERVDERGDVYALGAILYHLLAGRAPFVRAGEASVSWENMLARVIADPPPALADLQPEAPRDLLAIVARAMARDPAARYASAGALAEDLVRFQTGQLVGAHRYSRRQLIARWLRRYRTAVAVAAVGIAVLAVTSTVMIARIVRERDDAEVARVDAEGARKIADAQRTRADEQRDSAEHLVGFMLSDLKPQLDRVGRLDIMRGVANTVDDYYARLPPASLDPRATDQRRVALRVLGDVLIDQGDSAAAKRAYTSALAVQPGATPDAITHRARAEIELGAALLDGGDLAGATAACERGRAALEALAQRTPEAEIALATAYRRLGTIAFQAAHLDDAAAQLARCAEHARLAVVATTNPADTASPSSPADAASPSSPADAANPSSPASPASPANPANPSSPANPANPANPSSPANPANPANPARLASAPAKKELAKCLDRTSDVDSARSDPTAAEHDARAALDLRTTIIRDDPGDLEATFGTSVSWDKLFRLAVDAHQPAQAQIAADNSLAIIETLVQREPDNVQWSRELALVYLRRAEMQFDADHPAEAARIAARAVDLADEIVRRAPNDAERLADLADILGKYGSYLGEAQQFAPAVLALDRALAAADRASVIAPTNTQYRASVATMRQYRGDVLKDKGDYPAAAAEYKTRLAIDLALLHDAPTDAALQKNANTTRWWYGYMLAQTPATRANGVTEAAAAVAALHVQDAAKQLPPEFASTLTEMDAQLALLRKSR